MYYFLLSLIRTTFYTYFSTSWLKYQYHFASISNGIVSFLFKWYAPLVGSVYVELGIAGSVQVGVGIVGSVQVRVGLVRSVQVGVGIIGSVQVGVGIVGSVQVGVGIVVGR